MVNKLSGHESFWVVVLTSDVTSQVVFVLSTDDGNSIRFHKHATGRAIPEEAKFASKGVAERSKKVAQKHFGQDLLKDELQGERFEVRQYVSSWEIV